MGVQALEQVGRPVLVAERSGRVRAANPAGQHALGDHSTIDGLLGPGALPAVSRVIESGHAEILSSWLVSRGDGDGAPVAWLVEVGTGNAARLICDGATAVLRRQAKGDRLAELCRDLARLGAEAVPGARCLIEVSDGEEPVLVAAWPGHAPDDPGLVDALAAGYSALQPSSPLVKEHGAGSHAKGGAWRFSVRDSGVRAALLVLAPAHASVDEGLVTSLGAALTATVSWWDTDRKMRDLAERYRLVSEATQHVLYDWDISTDVIAWSPRLKDLFGHSPKEEDLGIAWWKSLLHPEDAGRVASSLDKALKAGDLFWLSEYRFRRADGSYAWVLDRGAIVYEQRRPVRMVGVREDLSRDREVQSQLVRAARLATVGTLASGVAHEINNPLAWITSNLGFALEELGHLTEKHGENEHIDEAVDALDDAKAGASRIAQVVNDLKTFTHADNEVAHVVSVTRAVETALSMAGNELRHRARVVKRLEPVPHVLANKARLSQAVLNVLLNAANSFTNRTGVTGEIVISTRAENGGSLIEIADNGAGIPEEMVPRIFDPFFTTRPVGEGLGIGLAITSSIVQALGGTITVDSKLEQGTTFRIWLPAAAQQRVEPAESPTPVPAQKTRRASILVIDDEPLILQAFERVLGGGHDVRCFERAEPALEALKRAPTDLVFCDLHMPGVSGPAFYEQLGAIAPSLAERVVFMTGGAFTPESRAFLAVVRPHVLDKPFTVEALRALVAERIAHLDAGKG